MKHLLILLLLLCSMSVVAQDVIVKKDGSTVVCRVIEVNATEITYKKWGDLNGSNYIMDKSLASAINYENGKKEVFGATESLYKPNNQNDGTQAMNDRALLEMDARVNSLKNDLKMRKVRNVIRWTGGIFLAAAGVGGILNDSSHDEKSTKVQTYTGVLLCEGAAAWLITSAISHQNQIKQLKAQLQNTTSYLYDIPLFNGSSLSLGADLISDVQGSKTYGLALSYNF